MAEETTEGITEEKRPAVKARKAEAQQAQKMVKGARRKQRTGTGPKGSDRADRAYGTRSVGKLHHGPAISITVQLPGGSLRRRKPGATKQGKGHTAKGAVSSRQQGVKLVPRRLFRPALALLAIAAAGAVFYYYPFNAGSKEPVETAAAATRTAPDYKPLVPSAEKATASSYDSKRNMVSYNVTFSGARMTVSQQGLPANFTTDPSAIMKAADSIKATQQIETNRGMLFIATHEEAGDQLALIADKDVLIFIHADKKVEDATWKSFIDLLEAKSWEAVKS
jgi:hypothetical protein